MISWQYYHSLYLASIVNVEQSIANLVSIIYLFSKVAFIIFSLIFAANFMLQIQVIMCFVLFLIIHSTWDLLCLKFNDYWAFINSRKLTDYILNTTFPLYFLFLYSFFKTYLYHIHYVDLLLDFTEYSAYPGKSFQCYILIQNFLV